MTERTCTEPDCAAPHKARGLCNAHYLTLRRSGGVPRVNPRECSLGGCADVATARGYCDQHYMLWWRYGDPTVPLRRGHKYASGPANPNWRGDDVGWFGVHNRLRSYYGNAREFSCVDCGLAAEEWSYDHTDPDERPSTHGPYSTDLTRYVPRCVPCHRRFDFGRG